ncbi:MAG TPA: hypothetical protein VGL39_22050 [Jatrophihabitantaceae bacterium]|jgi:hypothetical protein
MGSVRRFVTGTVVFGVGLASAVTVASAAPLYAPPTPSTAVMPGAFGSISPARLLDTRTGSGAPAGKVTSAHPETLQVLGRGGVPASGVSAVVLTVTVLTPTATGGVTVWANGTDKPGTTNVAFVKGVNVANQVVSAVGSDGKVELSDNSPGTFDLVADVSGYYLAGTPTAAGTTALVAPARILDTRAGATPHRVAPGGTVTLTVGGHGGVPSEAGAALLDLTVLTPSAGGGVTAYPAGTSKPATSTITYAAGRIIANLAAVKLGTGAQIVLANNSSGSIDLVADVMGYVLPGSAVAAATYVSTTPARFLDTRTGVGAPKAAVAAGKTVTLQIAGRGGVPATNVAGVTMTVTVVSPDAAGGVTVWPDGESKPGTTNVTFASKQSVADLVTVPVGADGRVVVSNNSPGSVALVADVVGYYRADVLPIATSTSRYVRNLTNTASDASTMHDEGCADAQGNASGSEHLQLLDIGAQYQSGSTWGAALSVVDTKVPDANLVTAINGYVDGYASCRTGTDRTIVAIATNNDALTAAVRGTSAGGRWAGEVINPVAAHAASYAGVVIAGANDIESDFRGLVTEAAAWTRGYLAATSAPYIFIGAATGCPTTGPGGTCKWGWTERNYFDLAHGIAPTRILALPQIYYQANATQWRYIAATGASGANRVDFIGSLSEFAACQNPGSGCDLTGLLTASASWQALRSALSSNAAISLQRLPISTDLRIDTDPGAPGSAKRVTTAGVN